MRQPDPPVAPPRRRPAGPSGDPELNRLLAWVEGCRGRARRRLRRGTAGPSTAAETPGVVQRLDRVTDSLIRFTVTPPAGFDYRPGASVRLEVEGVRRRYTIVSAPHEPSLEFFVELVPGGAMSRRLAGLRPGGRVTIASDPRPGLTLEAGRRPLMLATVTGVNPFVSLLRDAEARGRRDLRAVLVHGASFRDEFGYDRELAGLAARRPDLLTYIPAVSRPEDPRNRGWAGAEGRLGGLLDSVRDRFALDPAGTVVLACGNPAMIDGARAHLGALGYTLRSESYG